jgi:serine/threonine protein kinase
MRQHVHSYEAWDNDDDAFHHTVTVWKEGENYYQLSHPARPGSFNLDDLPTPTPIPTEFFKGLWHPSLTECPHPFPADSYQKMPAIMLPEDYKTECAEGVVGSGNFRKPSEDMIEEARIYEILKQHPHPNICHYYGCVRDGKYVTAVCLKKYLNSLEDVIQSGGILDRDGILCGIWQGLQFLHNTLGLAHNDINPNNIMLDERGVPIIIDFDSCAPIGQDVGLQKGGTFGWVKQLETSMSAAADDVYAFTLIAQYMDRKLDGCFPLPPNVRFALLNFAPVLMISSRVL